MFAGLRHDDRIELLAAQYTTKTNGSYTCTLCKRLCRDKYSAKLHLDSVHFSPAEGYPCDICTKTLKSYNGLMAHKTNYHKHL